MLEVMMALGTYRFSLSTAAYERLRRRAAWRWPAQDLLGETPALQYVGPGEQTIEIEGTLYPHYKGLLGLPNLLARVPGLAAALGTVASVNSALTRVGMALPGLGGGTGNWALQQLREDADQGVPLLLVDGRGNIWGYWVLLDLEERERRHLADGSALAIEFAAGLRYYGDTAPSALSAPTGVVGAVRGLLGI